MEKPTYERCQYLGCGQCPYESIIERALLIPQILDPVQIAAAQRICDKCGQVRVERRKAVRVERPLRVDFTKRDNGERYHGAILNVSGGGALVKLKDWGNFHMEEIIHLILSSYGSVQNKSQNNTIRLDGIIRRLMQHQNAIAIAFIEEISAVRIVNV
jgi:hypothetical protein